MGHGLIGDLSPLGHVACLHCNPGQDEIISLEVIVWVEGNEVYRPMRGIRASLVVISELA